MCSFEVCILLLLFVFLSILLMRFLHDVHSNNFFISLLYSILVHEYLYILQLMDIWVDSILEHK